MTHDELLAKMAEPAHKLNASDARNVYLLALRAVVELHKPNGFGCAANCIEVDDDGYAWKNTAYPCPTIQAIEKELQCQ